MIYLGDEWGVCEILAGVSPAVRYIDRFHQFLRQAQILILKIRAVFPRFKIFAFLELGEKSWFSFGHE